MGAITKLDAVNHMLLMAGESLVSDLEGESGLDTEVSLFILERNITDFQLRGMASNTYVKKYNLSTDGIIDLPTDTLSAELVSYHTNDDGERIKANARQDSEGNIRLHNLTDHMNSWDASKDYYVEVIYALIWEEMDTPVQRSIMASSARQYQLVMQGDGDVDNYLGQIESLYMAKGKSADIDDKNYSIFSSATAKAREIFQRRSVYNDPSRFRFWNHTDG